VPWRCKWNNRALCAPANIQGRCQWFGLSKTCSQGCPAGWFRITQGSLFTLRQDDGRDFQKGPLVLGGGRATTTLYRTDTVTVQCLALRFTRCNLADDGIMANPCWPSTLTNAPGYALLAKDAWYNSTHNARFSRGVDFLNSPPAILTQGKIPVNSQGSGSPFKRDFHDPIFFVDEGNSSHRANDVELLENYGLLRCKSEDCAEEAEALGLDHTMPARRKRAAGPKTAQ